MSIKLTGTKELSNFCRPYVIAEIGANHNGDMDLARQMIAAAKAAGADCVKFQSWSKRSLFTNSVYGGNQDLEEAIDKYAISNGQLLEMKKYAGEVGIDLASTPFNMAEADYLVDVLDSPFIKVASMDVDNLAFLEYLADKGRPIIISTGLSELHEIAKAIKTIEDAGNSNIVILHCVSSYPPEDKDLHLNNITTLMRLYPEYPVGFSDHTIGTAIPLAAVALGACVIEKHFTLDKAMEGWDHAVSATPDELRAIVENSQRVTAALGSARIQVSESQAMKNAFRRSVVLRRDMRAGEVIVGADLDVKRPGTGINPGDIKLIIGRRLAKEKKEDALLSWDDFA
jgi:sialic acid synthase SpsE